jgi:regulator of sirC expression with transglutaminase-like and TPR domain
MSRRPAGQGRIVSHAFAALAAEPAAPVEELALGIAGEFRSVDAAAVRAELDALGAEVSGRRGPGPEGDADALAAVLAGRHDFRGDEERYDHPDNSMIDRVLQRRRGLPILLSAVYVAVAGRAGIPLAGVGLPGHFVVAHLGAATPLVLDPFAGGARVAVPGPVRPWTAHATALRMLNNLVASFDRRGDVMGAIRAAELRLELPAGDAERGRLADEALALRARLN